MEDQTRGARTRDYICKMINRVLFWCIQYPCYTYNVRSGKFLDLERDVPTEELEEYERSSVKNRSRMRQLAIITVMLIYMIKNLLVPIITLRTMDYRDIRSNGSNQWPVNEVTHQRVCIQSNCSRFYSPTEFTVDIRHFPVLPVCYPTLNKIFNPLTYLGPFALLGYSFAAFIVLIYGIMLQLCQLNSPQDCDTYLIVIAPRIFKRVVLSKAKDIIYYCQISYSNYVRYVETHRSTCAREQFYLRRPFNIYKSCSKMISGGLYPQADDLRDRSSVNQYQDQFINDCLPITISLWGHSMAQILVLRVFFLVLMMDLSIIVIAFADFLSRVYVKSQEYSTYIDEITTTGCKVWFPMASGGIQLMPLALYELKFTLLNTSDNVILCLLTGIVPALIAAFYSSTFWIIFCWRSELYNYLEMLCEVIRLQSIKKWSNDGAFNAIDELEEKSIQSREYVFCNDLVRNSSRLMDVWRGLLQRSFETKYLGFRAESIRRLGLRCDGQEHRCTKLNLKIAKQQLVMDMMSKNDIGSDEQLTELLEKVYVSFRLFSDYVYRCSNSMLPLAITVYLLTFGLIIIAVWHGQLIGKFTYEHTLITTFNLFFSVSLLVMIANIHAKVSIDSGLIYERWIWIGVANSYTSYLTLSVAKWSTLFGVWMHFWPKKNQPTCG